MKWSDIQISHHNGSQGKPMVNVKVYDSPTRALAERVENESGMTGFADWYERQSDDTVQSAWDFACEIGFENATQEARILGDAYASHYDKTRRVWTTGRSGGWLYVDELADVSEWDSEAVERWSVFATRVRSLADDIPYDALDILAQNDYAAECQDFADAEFAAENQMADAMRDLLATVVGR